MIQVSAQAFAIDDGLAVFQSVKVGAGSAVVEPVGLLGSEAWTGILDDAGAFANGRGGKDSDCMNARGTNH